MKIEANSPHEYINQLPDDREKAMTLLRQTILDNLPKGFEETMSYGMIGYVVPHSIYPDGYHSNPKLPLPFINIASQKYFIALYHSEFMQKKNYRSGLKTNIPNTVKLNWIWGKVVSVLRKLNKYHLI